MSGGSHNYAYRPVEDFDAIYGTESPEREAFAKLLTHVANAMRAIEWVDSGDYGPGAEDAAIRACFEFARALEFPPAK